MNTHFAAEFISKYVYWIFIIILMINLTQRKQAEYGRTKRYATLFISLLFLALLMFSAVLIQFDLPDLLLIPFAALLAGAAWRWRRNFFPFKLRCATCGARLDWNRFMNFDDNLCTACAEKRTAGDAAPAGNTGDAVETAAHFAPDDGTVSNDGDTTERNDGRES